jgi:hypothetical protein
MKTSLVCLAALAQEQSKRLLLNYPEMNHSTSLSLEADSFSHRQRPTIHLYFSGGNAENVVVNRLTNALLPKLTRLRYFNTLFIKSTKL